MSISRQNTIRNDDLGVSLVDSDGGLVGGNLIRDTEIGISLQAQGSFDELEYSYHLSGVLAEDSDGGLVGGNLIRDTEIGISLQAQGSFDEPDDTFDFSGHTDDPVADHNGDGLVNSIDLVVWRDSVSPAADEPGLPGVTVYLDTNFNDSFDATTTFDAGFVL